MPKDFHWMVAAGALGVILGGLIIYYGRDIQILRDAHEGFDM